MSDIFKVLQRTASGLSGLGEFAPAIVGSVDEGAIIERGSNANGEYIKLADGTMWCWGQVAHSFNTTELYQTVQLSFPASFVDSNISGSIYHMSAPGRPMVCANFSPSASALIATFWGMGEPPTSTAVVSLRWFALGRWK